MEHSLDQLQAQLLVQPQARLQAQLLVQPRVRLQVQPLAQLQVQHQVQLQVQHLAQLPAQHLAQLQVQQRDLAMATEPSSVKNLKAKVEFSRAAFVIANVNRKQRGGLLVLVLRNQALRESHA